MELGFCNAILIYLGFAARVVTSSSSVDNDIMMYV